MRYAYLLLFAFTASTSDAQIIDSLNTAKNCRYMNKEEKEMIYEINLVRSNPRSYLQYIDPLLRVAEGVLKANGKGEKNYSLTITTIRQ